MPTPDPEPIAAAAPTYATLTGRLRGYASEANITKAYGYFPVAHEEDCDLSFGMSMLRGECD